ncbi:amidohydrolase family protein, partial [Desulfovibrio sp. OttesenSCG-928-O18]|nr:amidohydrolase family protein [Desulfovibrio sp. OttesenSCG-928-O18]
TGDYADRAGHRGNSRYSDEHLAAVLGSAVANGFQVCIHAIGDAAVLQAIRTLETVRRSNPGEWLRHRIEHFQMAGPEVVARAMALGVITAMQTIHAVADKPMAETRLTPDQLAVSYPWRAVLDRGGIIANGSDSPMDGVNPFHGFHAAVSRTAFSCHVEADARVRMTREEALKSYTLWAAAAEQAQARKGSLTPGKAADFIVLDRDIMTCPEDAIKDTRVLMTVLAGETVFGGL